MAMGLLRQKMLLSSRSNYSEGIYRYQNPIQYPTSSDIKLRCTLFSTTNTLPRPRGKYVRHPPLLFVVVAIPRQLIFSSEFILFLRKQ